MKYLVILVVVLVVFWIWRSGRDALNPPAREADPRTKRSAPPRLEMVRCRVCGLHLPEAEAVRAEAAYYCSVDHLNQARSGGGSGDA